MGAERGFRRDAHPFSRQLDQRARIVDVAVINMHTQVRVGGSPTAWPNTDKTGACQGRIELADRPFQFDPRAGGGQLKIAFGRDEQDVANAYKITLRAVSYTHLRAH